MHTTSPEMGMYIQLHISAYWEEKHIGKALGVGGSASNENAFFFFLCDSVHILFLVAHARERLVSASKCIACLPRPLVAWGLSTCEYL